MHLGKFHITRTSLRQAWRRAAVAGIAASTVVTAAPTAEASTRRALPLRGEAAALAALPRESRMLPDMARGRQIIVVNEHTFNGMEMTPENVRRLIAPHLPASAVPLTAVQAGLIGQTLREDSPAAFRLTNSEGQRVGCVISVSATARSAPYYANMISGVPAEWLEGQLPGVGRHWNLSILFHEAAHCGQNFAPGNMFQPARTLTGEIHADQKMMDVFEDRFSGRHRRVALAVRDMRAIGAVHYSYGSHHTAAGVFTNAEARRWRGPAPTGENVYADMERLLPLLTAEVSRMVYHRTDLYTAALAAEIRHIESFTPPSMRALHPLVMQQPRLQAELQAIGAEAFINRYSATHGDLVTAMQRRVGEQMRRNRTDRETYAYFAAAAQNLRERQVFAPNTYGARFLDMYIAAVNTHVIEPGCAATPAAAPAPATRSWYCRAA